jgi:hypothetical protein
VRQCKKCKKFFDFVKTEEGFSERLIPSEEALAVILHGDSPLMWFCCSCKEMVNRSSEEAILKMYFRCPKCSRVFHTKKVKTYSGRWEYQDELIGEAKGNKLANVTASGKCCPRCRKAERRGEVVCSRSGELRL